MHDTRPLVSILAPAYNEAGILADHLTRIVDYTETLAARYRFELIVVDDGSTDGTGNLARAFAASRPNIRVVQHRVNLGLGHALRSGFGACHGEYIVVLDLDLSYAPQHIEVLLERIVTTRAQVVLASPYMKGGRTSSVPFLRKLLSRWGNRFLALTARGVNPGGNISTLTGMVRAYETAFIRSLNLKSTGMEINTEILYKCMLLGARVEEVPAHLDWTEQRKTQSIRTSSKRIRRGIVFSLLAGFIIRPVAFFIVPAGMIALIWLYAQYWITSHVLAHYVEVAPAGQKLDFALSESVALAFRDAPHAFIIGGMTLLLSVQLFSLGVVALQNKQYFEELFHFSTRLYAQTRELERLLSRQVPPDGTDGSRGTS